MLRNYRIKGWDMKNFSTRPKDLAEYILVVRPEEEISQMIMEERKHFLEAFGNYNGIKGKPFISIYQFLAWENMEDTIVRWLQRISKDQNRFMVTLNNYSGIPSHKVVLRVQDITFFKELVSRIQAIAPYTKEKNGTTEKGFNYPYITIAKKLSAAIYEDAIKVYSKKEFHGSFEATELILLKKANENDMTKEIAVFRLQPAYTIFK